ncbi:MAG: hypothetical protein MN733_43385 [Nitrososphaera sp.]|nr:hypothetical protein [Nitrososphaera sp.]
MSRSVVGRHDPNSWSEIVGTALAGRPLSRSAEKSSEVQRRFPRITQGDVSTPGQRQVGPREITSALEALAILVADPALNRKRESLSNAYEALQPKGAKPKTLRLLASRRTSTESGEMVEKLISGLKNYRVVAIVVVAGIAIAGLGTVAGGSLGTFCCQLQRGSRREEGKRR